MKVYYFRLTCFLYLMLGAHAVTLCQDQLRVVGVTSLEEAWAQALVANPDYQNYALSREKAARELKVAKAARLPSLTGSFTGQKNHNLAVTPVPGELLGQPGETVNLQFGQEYTYNAGLNLSKSLFDWKTRLNIDAAKLDVRMATAQQSVFEQALKQQVAQHYHTALIAFRAIAIHEQDLRLADSLLVLAQLKRAEGIADALSLNKAMINQQAVALNLLSSRQLLDQSETELRVLLGLAVQDQLQLNEQLDYALPPAQSLEALSPVADLDLYAISSKQADVQVKLQKSNFVPQLSLNNYLGKQQFRNDFGMSFGEDAWSDLSYTSLSLSVPIFTGFANKNRYRASLLQQEMADNELEHIKNETAIRDQHLLSKYHSSIEEAEIAKTSFELYAQNLSLTREQYEAGLVSLDATLKSFEDYLKAENAFLSSLSSTYSYYSEILTRVK